MFWIILLLIIWALYCNFICYNDPSNKDVIRFEQYTKYYNKKYPNHPESDYERGGKFTGYNSAIADGANEQSCRDKYK